VTVESEEGSKQAPHCGYKVSAQNLNTVTMDCGANLPKHLEYLSAHRQ